uniref:aminoacyl--tRNA ligase-related protein n=1 Tax=Bacillus sp. WP8 TaxID=756828 RepID=UPI0037C0009D
MRMGEFGEVDGDEFRGGLNGLLRVRRFWEDAAEIFLREDEMEGEMKGILELVDDVYGRFGFEYSVELWTGGEK